MNPSPESPRKTPRSCRKNPHLSASTAKKPPPSLRYPLSIRQLFPAPGSLSSHVSRMSSDMATRQAAVAYKYAIAAAAAAELTAAVAAAQKKFKMKCKTGQCHCAKRDPRCKRRRMK